MHSNTFSENLLKIIMTTDSFTNDIDNHIKNIRILSEKHIEDDKDANLRWLTFNS